MVIFLGFREAVIGLIRISPISDLTKHRYHLCYKKAWIQPQLSIDLCIEKGKFSYEQRSITVTEQDGILDRPYYWGAVCRQIPNPKGNLQAII